MIKMGEMVLKGVNCVHNAKIKSYGLEKSHLGKQYKNQVKWLFSQNLRILVNHQNFNFLFKPHKKTISGYVPNSSTPKL